MAPDRRRADPQVVRWFPLDRLGELEAAIREGVAAEGAGPRALTRRRNWLAVALGLHGLRIGEVQRARRTDLREDEGRLVVRTIKRGRPRDLPLDPTLIQALLAWRVEALAAWPRGPPDYLLYSHSGRAIRDHGPEATAKRCFRCLLGPGRRLVFHSLRHTFAMRVYAQTHDLSLVKRLLGHVSVTSTEVYARSLEEVPASCLVRLGTAAPLPGQQLRLYDPDSLAVG